jgi:alcohol dehydrogenase
MTFSSDDLPISVGTYEVWHQWQKVQFGNGCVSSLSGELARLGATRVLLVTTRSLKREAKLLTTVRSAIGNALVGEFDESDQHVPRPTVLAAKKSIRGLDPDCIVSFGGSSVIDTAKALAMVLAEDINTDQGFEPYKVVVDLLSGVTMPSLLHNPVPHVALPTTLSGGEYTGVIGITDPITRRKDLFSDDRLSPRTILLDPQLTSATPHRLWASSGVKTMSDAIEQIYSTKSHPMVEALCIRAIEWFHRYLPTTDSTDPDIRRDARLRCQIASWMAISGANNAGTVGGIGASLRHQLGPMYEIPHGEAMGVVLPHVLAFNAPAIRDGYALLARALGVTARSRTKRIEAVIQAISDLVASLGLPNRLEPIGVSRKDLPTVAHHVMQDFATQTNPRRVENETQVIRILEEAM